MRVMAGAAISLALLHRSSSPPVLSRGGAPLRWPAPKGGGSAAGGSAAGGGAGGSVGGGWDMVERADAEEPRSPPAVGRQSSPGRQPSKATAWQHVS